MFTLTRACERRIHPVRKGESEEEEEGSWLSLGTRIVCTSLPALECRTKSSGSCELNLCPV